MAECVLQRSASVDGGDLVAGRRVNAHPSPVPGNGILRPAAASKEEPLLPGDLFRHHGWIGKQFYVTRVAQPSALCLGDGDRLTLRLLQASSRLDRWELAGQAAKLQETAAGRAQRISAHHRIAHMVLQFDGDPLACEIDYRALPFERIGLWMGRPMLSGIQGIPVKHEIPAVDVLRPASDDRTLVRRSCPRQALVDGRKRVLEEVERYMAVRRRLPRGR